MLCLHLCPTLDMKVSTKNVWAHSKPLTIFCLTEFYPEHVISPVRMPGAITVAHFPRIKSNLLTMAFITLKMRGQSLLLSPLHHTSVVPEYGHEFLPLCSFATGICPIIVLLRFSPCFIKLVPPRKFCLTIKLEVVSHSLVLSQPSSARVFCHLSHYDPQQNYLMGPVLPQNSEIESTCVFLYAFQCLVQCFVHISLK